MTKQSKNPENHPADKADTQSPDNAITADENINTRCGYVALVGRPNVGKSTLMNRILGTKVSIVTAKPQTTRQQVAGIKSSDDGQVIYLDTPGIHEAAHRALSRHMNRIAHAALREVDLVLFLVEANRWSKQDEYVARALTKVDVPVVLVINKIDLLPDKTRLAAFLKDKVDASRFEKVLLVSAKSGAGVAEVERTVKKYLPFSRPFYDADQYTDRSERFLAGELIREQLMMRLHQEIPYSLAVEIEEFKRTDKLLRLGAIVWVERQGQKQIVIGKGGDVLKQVGTLARKELEKLFDEKVFLRLWVKVSKEWSDSERALRQLGFEITD